jgi:hypothetical protein
MAGVHVRLPDEALTAFSFPITEDELNVAVRSGKWNKAPGLDGIPTDFFQLTWDITKKDILSLVNEMYQTDALPAAQKRGVVSCVPKVQVPTVPTDYRFLTLLNTDLRLFARLLVNRLKPWLSPLLHPSQYCGVKDANILDALAAIRDNAAKAELTHDPVCFLSIDFKEALDKVAHSYLFSVLETYGLGPRMINAIRNLYTDATSVGQINGFITYPVTMDSSIRQGFPLSTRLFAVSLDPLLQQVNDAVRALRPPQHQHTIGTVAYVDDVTFVLRSPREVHLVQQVLNKYVQASGAVINYQKSRALALGSWNPDTPVMGIPYHLEVRILGVLFTNKVRLSTTTSWRLVTQAIRHQAHDSYHRDLALHLRIQYVNIYLLAKAWHLPQIFSHPKVAVARINTVISWYIWKGSVFRVPLSTLYRPKHKGGWQLTHLDAKCRTLLYCRLHQMCTQDSTPSGRWLLR